MVNPIFTDKNGDELEVYPNEHSNLVFKINDYQTVILDAEDATALVVYIEKCRSEGTLL